MNELDILRIVSERLERLEIPFMLTGSYAMAYYATPRMTRDLDLVVALEAAAVQKLIAAFAADFYVDADTAHEAVRSGSMFNMMHLASGIKLDLILKKATPYRDLEFSRRTAGELGGVSTWLVSREDLILSKLVWARDSGSELQLRDVRALLSDTVDRDYLGRWAAALGVTKLLNQLTT
ncbi:MAG: nucleotidyl transferase AbiEii/AbiGii toxin family protein [Steroidobacteraceae bacterium]